MRKYQMIGAAVAAALCAQSAMALNPAASIGADIFLNVTGASAQRDTFRGVLEDTDAGSADEGMCVTGTFNVYTLDDSDANTSEDFRAYSCTLKTGVSNVPVAIEGLDVVVYYRSEGGSVYGIGPLLPSNPSFAAGVKRFDFGASQADCALAGVQYTCTSIAGYSLETDSATNSAHLANAVTQLGVSDIEPVRFGVTANWPGVSVLGSTPSPAGGGELDALNGSAVPANGTAFMIVASNSGPAAGLTNISRQTLASILNRTTTNWNKVEDNGAVPGAAPLAAGAIRLCRRDAGSGTQASMGIFALGTGCSSGGVAIANRTGGAAGQGPAGAGPVVENQTSGQMGACAAVANSIGFVNVGSAPSGTHIVNIDGIVPTKQNAALGRYGFAYEATMQKRAGLSGNVNILADALVQDSRRAIYLNTGATQSAFALGAGAPISNTPTIAAAQSSQPIALGSRSKNSCRPVLNSF